MGKKLKFIIESKTPVIKLNEEINEYLPVILYLDGNALNTVQNPFEMTMNEATNELEFRSDKISSMYFHIDLNNLDHDPSRYYVAYCDSPDIKHPLFRQIIGYCINDSIDTGDKIRLYIKNDDNIETKDCYINHIRNISNYEIEMSITYKSNLIITGTYVINVEKHTITDKRATEIFRDTLGMKYLPKHFADLEFEKYTIDDHEEEESL